MIAFILVATSLLFILTLLMLRGTSAGTGPRRSAGFETAPAPPVVATPAAKPAKDTQRIRRALESTGVAEVANLRFAPGGDAWLEEDLLRETAELLREDPALRLRFIGVLSSAEPQLVRSRVDYILNRLRTIYDVDPGVPRSEQDVGNEELNPGIRRIDFYL